MQNMTLMTLMTLNLIKGPFGGHPVGAASYSNAWFVRIRGAGYLSGL